MARLLTSVRDEAHLNPHKEYAIYCAYEKLDPHLKVQEFPTLQGKKVPVLDYRYDRLRRDCTVIVKPTFSELISEIIRYLKKYKRPHLILKNYRKIQTLVMRSKALECWIPQFILPDINQAGISSFLGAEEKIQQRRLIGVSHRIESMSIIPSIYNALHKSVSVKTTSIISLARKSL